MFVLDPGDADGFIGSLLGSGTVEAGFDLAVTWSLANGLAVEGAGGLVIRIPLGMRIGPVEIFDVELAATVGGESGEIVTITAAAALGASIGPISASVDGLGLIASLTSGPDPLVRIGELGIDIGFKPPNGVGIGVDLDVVSGGGYLYIDAAAGSYAGVLDLEVMGIGISAVAIIDTKLPDVDGWSMFFALFLDLPSIQLGFGFTLTGVGGVAGINRAIDVDTLGSAVRSGSLDTILFPADPIAEAPVIIEEFRAIFPPADGSYVFGPIVRIGWGTPTLIEAQLGVVIQLPDPVVIVVLGSIAAILPTPDFALVELHLDVAGVIDVDAGTLAIDASLHDSHVVGFALSGDMALRADFADAEAFLMSVGGFHPRFEAPGDFPDLRRVTFGIHAGSVLRIDFKSYFAITSNSVQCGADFTLDADVMGFGVYGSCGFDALIEFSPFRILTSVEFEVSITAAGIDLLGVKLTASVEGPNRWHVIGTARFEVLGIGKDIRVDELIGSKQTEPPVPPADVLLDVIGALEAAGAVVRARGGRRRGDAADDRGSQRPVVRRAVRNTRLDHRGAPDRRAARHHHRAVRQRAGRGAFHVRAGARRTRVDGDARRLVRSRAVLRAHEGRQARRTRVRADAIRAAVRCRRADGRRPRRRRHRLHGIRDRSGVRSGHPGRLGEERRHRRSRRGNDHGDDDSDPVVHRQRDVVAGVRRRRQRRRGGRSRGTWSEAHVGRGGDRGLHIERTVAELVPA